MVDTNSGNNLPYNHNRTRWAVLILVIAAITAFCIVFGYHWDRFGDHLKKGSTQIADWGTFGDFIGGMTNPILSCLTIALLAYTLILQSRQLSISSEELRLSRIELELTRAELKRTAEAQELSEKALRAQAEATAINLRYSIFKIYYEYYTEEAARLRKNYSSLNSEERADLMEFDERLKALHGFLDSQYKIFISREQNNP